MSVKLKTEPRSYRMNPLGLRPEVLIGIIAADGCARDCGFAGIRLTCGTDGVHRAHSKHYSGCAVDFTLWTPETDRPDAGAYEPFVSRLKERLGPDYDVVLERVGDVIWVHLEWDPEGR